MLSDRPHPVWRSPDWKRVQRQIASRTRDPGQCTPRRTWPGGREPAAPELRLSASRSAFQRGPPPRLGVDDDVAYGARLTRQDQPLCAVARRESILDVHRDDPRDQPGLALATDSGAALKRDLHTGFLGSLENGELRGQIGGLARALERHACEISLVR